jgi:hypothetical protein
LNRADLRSKSHILNEEKHPDKVKIKEEPESSEEDESSSESSQEEEQREGFRQSNLISSIQEPSFQL